MIRYLFILLLACTPALAVEVQPTAKIYEPIVVKHAEGANIQILPWGGDVPRFLDERHIKREWDDATVFAAPPGAYIVFGGGGMAIVIIEGTGPPPTDPDDPKPDPSYKQLEDASRQGAAQLNDPATARAVADAIAAVIPQLKILAVQQQRDKIREVVGGVMAARPANNQLDWHGKWRTPVNSAVESLSPTAATYPLMVEAIVRGLRGAAAQASQSHQDSPMKYAGVSVIFRTTTRFRCEHCEQFKRLVMPTLQKHGATVVSVEAETNTPIPRFEVRYADRGPVEHLGFMSLEKFDGIVNSLRH